MVVATKVKTSQYMKSKFLKNNMLRISWIFLLLVSTSGFAQTSKKVSDSIISCNIIKIDTIKDISIIYCKTSIDKIRIISQNDTLHKCNPLVMGKKYTFKVSQYLSMSYSNHYSSVRYHDVSIPLQEKGYRWGLFISESLSGSCCLSSKCN
jgi:hypothetical protein